MRRRDLTVAAGVSPTRNSCRASSWQPWHNPYCTAPGRQTPTAGTWVGRRMRHDPHCTAPGRQGIGEGAGGLEGSA